jgi:hypothetical protein
MDKQHDNNLPPPIPPMEELRQYLLDPREDYPEPYYMLEFNGVPFSTLGGIQAISGQKKNGKSFVLTQLMAAILGNGGGRTSQYLPGLKVPERTIEYLGHEPKVLYIDTEMERLNSAKVLRRVHWLCDWDMKQPNERFNVLWLKTMPDDGTPPFRHRIRLLKLAVEILQPDIIFVDGLRDLLASINDEETATGILNYLGSLAEQRRMCIWLALHQNPRAGGDNDDIKMRGWAGTELGNKVSDTLISVKNKTQSGVTFTVKQQDARGKDLDDWKFQIVEDAGMLGIPKIVGNIAAIADLKADNPETIRAWLQQALETYDFPMSRADIKKKVFEGIGGQKNHAIQQKDLDAALNLNFLCESAIKKKGAYMLDVMPF